MLDGIFQDLFDLMANERVRLIVKGELGDVYAELAISDAGKWNPIAMQIGEDPYKVLRDLMAEAATRA